jgi:Flp pilus assembly pilin Flp
MKKLLVRLVREEGGQDLIEYSLLAALISVVCFTVLDNIGTSVNALFDYIDQQLTAATP